MNDEDLRQLDAIRMRVADAAGLVVDNNTILKEYLTRDSGKREEFDTGAVRDTRTGKGRYDLISPYALKRLAAVMERGATKYGDRNWEKGMPADRLLDSALRHMFQYAAGDTDEDHLGHAAFNIFAIMHFQEVDNAAQ